MIFDLNDKNTWKKTPIGTIDLVANIKRGDLRVGFDSVRLSDDEKYLFICSQKEFFIANLIHKSSWNKLNPLNISIVAKGQTNGIANDFYFDLPNFRGYMADNEKGMKILNLRNIEKFIDPQNPSNIEILYNLDLNIFGIDTLSARINLIKNNKYSILSHNNYGITIV